MLYLKGNISITSDIKNFRRNGDMYNVSIPEISKEEIVERYKKIKPVIQVGKVKYFLREFAEEELFNKMFICDFEKRKAGKVKAEEFIPCKEEFECIHKYVSPMVFKPSIAEVLAQIPESQVNFVDAFEIIDYPAYGEEFVQNKVVFDNGYHISLVRLYTSRDNPKVCFIG